MPGVPSNKACERCKKKHMKCDETRPACQRCQAANVDCPGYQQTRKFIDQGASVRRRFAPYQEPATRSEPTKPQVKGPKKNVTPQREIFAARGELEDSQKNEPQTPWACGRETQALEESGSGLLMAERPSQVGPPVVNSPLPVTSTPASGSIFSPTSKYDVSPVDESEQPSRDTIYHEMLPGTAQATSGSSHYSEVHQAGPSWDLTEQQSEGEELQTLFTDLRTNTEHETAFLMRYYSETVGTWLDISDSGKFFSVLVPTRALSSMSLKYAVAAITAKQLGLVGGVRPAFMTEGTILATTELYPNSSQVDWFLKATNYYYLANSSFSDHYTVMPSSSVFDSPINTLNAWLKTQMLEESGQQSYGENRLREIEDKLAAVTLMVFYKLLDSGIKEWHSHLSGINDLFESLMLHHPNSALLSHGIRASFWNFVRQDFCGGYILRAPTHISPANLTLWRAGGILIDDSKGFYMDSNRDMGLSQEDQCLNGLSWVLSRIVHFLFHLEKSQLEQWIGSPLSMPRRDLPETSDAVLQNLSGPKQWLELCFALQSWFEGLPESFRPCVRIEKPKSLDGTRLPFPETFFSSSTCAAAMQHYHFGRVALLLNRPEDDLASPNHDAFDRLKGYREVTKEVEYRCREVCSIALGRPPGAARFYMVPLLFGVGKCLETPEERQVVLEILRGIRNDLGLRTHSIASILVESWEN